MLKNKWIILLLTLTISGFTTDGVLDKQFPFLTGETLSGASKNLPDDAKGKYTLLAMAYSSDAENDLQTWLSPVYNKFIAKTGMFDSEYDVNLFFVPIFTGANIAFAKTMQKRMKEEVDKDIHPYVLFYKGEMKELKAVLGLEKKDTPYIFLLDKEGKIVYTTSGQYSDDKMEAIEDKIN